MIELSDATKEQLNAPFELLYDGEAEMLEVYDRFRDRIAVIDDDEQGKRIALLPELYEALKESAYEHCRVCLYGHAEDARHMPKPQDMATAGCTVSDYPHCPNRRWWEVLQKVSAGQ